MEYIDFIKIKLFGFIASCPSSHPGKTDISPVPMDLYLVNGGGYIIGDLIKMVMAADGFLADDEGLSGRHQHRVIIKHSHVLVTEGGVYLKLDGLEVSVDLYLFSRR